MKRADLPKGVTLSEFSPRDGLQNQERFIPTEAKVWLIDSILECGFTRTEVTSLGHPRYVPHFDTSLGGIGGQPPNIVDGIPVLGTGAKYTPSDLTGNTSTEDLACMFQEMGLETGLDLGKLLDLGRMLERIVGRELHSRVARTGPVPKGPTRR